MSGRFAGEMNARKEEWEEGKCGKREWKTYFHLSVWFRGMIGEFVGRTRFVTIFIFIA